MMIKVYKNSNYIVLFYTKATHMICYTPFLQGMLMKKYGLIIMIVFHCNTNNFIWGGEIDGMEKIKSRGSKSNFA